MKHRYTTLLLLASLLLYGCDFEGNPTAPRTPPIADFIAQTVVDDEFIQVRSGPGAKIEAPAPAEVDFIDESRHPRDGGARLNRKWFIDGVEVSRAVDLQGESFPRAGEYVVELHVEAGGESAKTSIRVVVTKPEGSVT